ncbi:unnamed protein product, partial [Prorocentrum cordatum]
GVRIRRPGPAPQQHAVGVRCGGRLHPVRGRPPGRRRGWHPRHGQETQEEPRPLPALRQAILSPAEEALRGVRVSRGEDPLLRVVQEVQAPPCPRHRQDEAPEDDAAPLQERFPQWHHGPGAQEDGCELRVTAGRQADGWRAEATNMSPAMLPLCV